MKHVLEDLGAIAKGDFEVVATEKRKLGKIDYLEFIIITMHMNKMDKQDCLYIDFQYFDKDKSRYITKEE